MCKAWSNDSYAKKLERRQVILIYEGDGYHFTSEDGETTVKTNVDVLRSTQEETDTRVVLYSMFAKVQGYKTVQVRTPDSDILFILLHHIDRLKGITLLFDTGSGNHRKIINMTEIARTYTEEYRAALLGMHAYCGCDSTSAFKGKGHVMPIKTLEKRPRFVSSLAGLGNSWDVSDGLVRELEEFTCAKYGSIRFTSLDSLRLFKIKEKCEDKPTNALRNTNMGTLPPCRKCLIQHIKRVNYQVAIWKRLHIADPDIPMASEEHGWTLVNGLLEPLWIDGELLPPQVVDFLEETPEAAEDDEDEAEEDIDELMDFLDEE